MLARVAEPTGYFLVVDAGARDCSDVTSPVLIQDDHQGSRMDDGAGSIWNTIQRFYSLTNRAKTLGAAALVCMSRCTPDGN